MTGGQLRDLQILLGTSQASIAAQCSRPGEVLTPVDIERMESGAIPISAMVDRVMSPSLRYTTTK